MESDNDNGSDKDKTLHVVRMIEEHIPASLKSFEQSPDQLSQLRFTDIFDLEEIQKIQDAFAQACGVASIITDVDGNPLTRPSNFCYLCEHIIRKTEKGLCNCYHSDAMLGRKVEGGPILQPCLSGGLWDGGTSICVGDRHIANWLVGQVLEEPVDEEKMMAYALDIGADPEEFRKALKDVTRMPRGQFAKICQALYLIATQLSRLAIRNVQQARFIAALEHAEQERSRLEEQLIQSRKLESVGQLAGGVAHDFNNMLLPIFGYAEILRDEVALEPAAQEYIQEILKAAERARALVSQLLAFARKQTLTVKPLNLNEVIQNFVSMLRRTIRENIEITVELSPQLGLIKADMGQIEQIIINLFANAQDAMPQGGELTVHTQAVNVVTSDPVHSRGVAAGEYVLMSVVDTGCGMNEATLDKVFEPFFTTKGLASGTGLGLSTVYGIVKQHEGHILVTSQPGQGTRFDLYFPVTNEPALKPGELPLSQDLQGGHETILVVEDQEQVRAMTCRMLERYGYKTLQAPDGPSALKFVHCMPQAERFDLLMTDIIMPQMNGRELFEALAAKTPGLKVLYMSGYNSDIVSHEGCLDHGVHFIQKPFTHQTLILKVRQVLDLPLESKVN